MSAPLLDVENLTVKYRTQDGVLTAVHDASFTLARGEYMGLIGESGSGKSTLAKALLHGLEGNGEITNGKVRYKGREIQDMTEAEMREEIRWNEISWIPQGSMNSLDPMQRISHKAIEIAEQHTDLSRDEALGEFEEMFETVGLPIDRITDYPFQFSGGMQQRAIIALALFLDPDLVIADEPTTALDVIMQDQVFKYFDRIHEETDVSMLQITHDINVVFESCDSTMIMHAGQIAEMGSVTDIYDAPRHPYTILLQESFPDLSVSDRRLTSIAGKPEKNFGEVDYCTFKNRCPWAVEECTQHSPSLEPATKQDMPDHHIACFRRDEVLEDYRERDGEAGALPEAEQEPEP